MAASSLAEKQRIATSVARWHLTSNTSAVRRSGYVAKPVLDIAAGRPRDATTQDYVAAFTQAGYEHRGERGVPGRQYFRRGEPRAYHVHLVEEGGPLWRDYVAFRDYLRTDAEAARQFADLKASWPRASLRSRGLHECQVVGRPGSPPAGNLEDTAVRRMNEAS